MIALSFAFLVGFADPPALPTSEFGVWHRLEIGLVFVPHKFAPSGKSAAVTVHLHGAPAVVEREWRAAESAGVLAVVTLPGLSSVYKKAFTEDAAFPRLLENVRARWQSRHPETVVGPVTVSSFSAGFGGVRELLKQPKSYARIDRLVLADTLYAGYKPGTREVEPAHVADFIRFARDAAAGKKSLLITYCQLQPPDYASTGETAAAILKALDGKTIPFADSWSANDWKPLQRFQKGKCEILSFPGATGEDHMQHLRRLALLYRRLAP